MMTTSASSFALATLSLAWEGIKRCVTNVGASGLTNKKKHQLPQLNYIILWISNSIELHRLRVCAHTNIFYVFPDGGAAPWPYRIRILKNIEPYVSSHERTGMYARAEFFRPGKVRRCIRKSTEARSFQIANPYGNYILRHSTAPLHQPDLIPVPDAYQTGPVAE